MLFSEIVELLLEVSLLMGVPPLMDVPAVYEVSPNQISKVCKATVKGCYIRPVVYIRSDLEAGGEKNGTLVHELVHHHQEMLGKFNSFPSCERYYLREQEAYFIQNEWLRTQVSNATFSIYPGGYCP